MRQPATLHGERTACLRLLNGIERIVNVLKTAHARHLSGGGVVVGRARLGLGESGGRIVAGAACWLHK